MSNNWDDEGSSRTTATKVALNNDFEDLKRLRVFPNQQLFHEGDIFTVERIEGSQVTLKQNRSDNRVTVEIKELKI